MSKLRSMLPLLGDRAFGAGIAAVLLCTALALPATAGDSPCASTRVANSLLHCEHCQAMKRLLNDERVQQLSVEVFDTPSGVLVRVDAPDLRDPQYLEEFVGELWTRRDHETRQLSASCIERYEHLMQAEVEEAPTDSGFFLILRSEDEKVVHWLQEDARRTREYVLAAASN